jgi:hypothetical protein
MVWYRGPQVRTGETLTSRLTIRRKVRNKWGLRVLPVNPMLDRWVDRAIPVTLSRDWLREVWYEACDKAGVPRPAA